VAELSLVRTSWTRIRAMPIVRRLRNKGLLHALIAPFWYSQNIRQPVRFIMREIMRRLRTDNSSSRYTLRFAPLSVRLRHNSMDAWILEEIFGRKIYEPPPEVQQLLPRDGKLTFVDLGGNIGMFAVYALARWPHCRVISFEPDPPNFAILEKCMNDNQADARWTAIEAAAYVSEGTLHFQSEANGTSHVTHESHAQATIEVAAVDIFNWLGSADLVKIDIEGGEWPILMDSRLGEALPRVFVVEYHPEGCPAPDGRTAIIQRFASLGYATMHMADHDNHLGYGVVWAWRV
jgi:FkbM family methyltransferase